ncbi:citryl-CoA lyase [Allomesorhizobium camelthorni]|uniref:citrate synthase (unknown stereospecificity) n=1 Tax=Allomesorhizobium camelthorni TaxID=475069 RepID=A0A6G4WGV7_9HYPH|nr:citryl-CoA lyase [Mesorhizobium camelthorni]NGO53456.1 citryl-CoA lyase [Mesorhizobium camelthorni]
MKRKSEIRTDIAWATPSKISIHGLDLCEEIIGKVDLGRMTFLQVFRRLPDQREARMFDAMMVVLVEHGITPSSLATRMTLCGAPEAVQAAIAAGLLGLGSVFAGSLDNAARMLQSAIPLGGGPEGDMREIAERLVDDYRTRKEPIPGIGHPFHKPIDPRAPALFAVAEETEYSGHYVTLINEVSAVATAQLGRPLPVNVTGAMGAIASEFGLAWNTCRGLAVAARAIGLVGHVLEEFRNPMAEEIYFRIEDEATRHARPE